MRTRLIVITPVAIAGAAAAILTAPIASAADTQACVAQIHATLCQSPETRSFRANLPPDRQRRILPTGRSSRTTAASGTGDRRAALTE